MDSAASVRFWELPRPFIFADASVQSNEEDLQGYKGDAQMRVRTKQRKGGRSSLEEEEEEEPPGKEKRGKPSQKQSKQKKLEDEFARLKKERGDDNSRLCGDLTKLKKHSKTAKHSIKHPQNCRVCGGAVLNSMCTICDVYLQFNPAKGKHVGKSCFHDYHDDAFFGLARCDTDISKVKKSDWVFPSKAKAKEHLRKIDKLIKPDFCDTNV